MVALFGAILEVVSTKEVIQVDLLDLILFHTHLPFKGKVRLYQKIITLGEVSLYC